MIRWSYVTTPHEDWAVLASPAGQAFCVGPRGPAGHGARPGVVIGPGAAASRLDRAWASRRDPAGGVYCLTARDAESGGTARSGAGSVE